MSGASYAGDVYSQQSSAKSQLPGRGPQLLSFESNDGTVGMDYISPTKLRVKETGAYFVMVSVQAGADQSVEAAGGYVDLWLVRNNKSIENSNSTMYVFYKQTTTTLVSQAILPLTAGDILSVGFSSTKSGIGLIATEPPEGEPTIGSASLSIFKISPSASVAKK